MQRLFDTKKQQGKTVDIFAAKKTHTDLTFPDGNISPFREYKQAPGPILTRNQEVSVSDNLEKEKNGLSIEAIRLREENERLKRERDTPYERFTIGNQPYRGMYSNYGQVSQDFLNNELQGQIGQFRNEIMQMVNESLKEFRENGNKNQETIGAIKDSIKNNGHNIEKLEEKIEKCHSSLETISGMFLSEIERIKNNMPHYQGEDKRKVEEAAKSQQDQRLQKLESDLKEMTMNFDRLQDEITQSVQFTLEEYGQVSEQENNTKINKVASDIEQRIEKSIESIDEKILSLEHQIHNQDSTEKLKSEMEEKLSEQMHGLRQQVQSLYQMMKTKSENSSPSKESSPEKERKDLSRFEYDNLKLEITALIDQVRFESRGFNAKFEDSDKRLNEQIRQIKEQIKRHQAESSTNVEQQSRDEFEKKIVSIEKRLDEVRQEQRDLNSNFNIQKAQLESFKTTMSITMNDIKANYTQLEEIQINNKVKSLTLDFSEWRSDIVNNVLRNLTSQLIPSIKGLIEFHLKASSSWIPYINDTTIEEISVHIGSELENLETLSLDFSSCVGSRITDKGMQAISIQMVGALKNLKDLTLNFAGCDKITDKPLLQLIGQVGSNRLDLKQLSLVFANCSNITEKVINDLALQIFLSLNKIESLSLNFQGTKITQKQIDILSKAWSQIPQKNIKV